MTPWWRRRAGVPVGNMTSAYNGIRWGSGLPRQFQYERTQSRIGGSLWQYPMRFVENSPVFWVDRGSVLLREILRQAGISSEEWAQA